MIKNQKPLMCKQSESKSYFGRKYPILIANSTTIKIVLP